MNIIKIIIKKIILKPLFKIISFFDKRKLCIIYVDGGLGSQINKLALGLNMESYGYTVKYDLEVYKNGHKDFTGTSNRNYDLDKICSYNIKKATKLEKIYALMNNSYKTKDLFIYDDSIFHQKTPIYLGWNFDNIKYWNNVRNELLDICSFSGELTNEAKEIASLIASDENNVIVHLRRGDYLNTVFDVTSIQYFNNAILYYINKKDIRNPKFYFFSNDIEWVNNIFIPQLPMKINFSIVSLHQNDNGYSDIALMSCAKNFILSNSSFSILGAFFSRYNNKNIIMPDHWFTKRFGNYFDEQLTESEFIINSQKAHDITGNTIFLPS